MGFFDCFKIRSNNEQFITKNEFNKNCKKQLQMIPQTLEQLRKLNVSEDKELRLEYFFYTNKTENAELLASELKNLNY